MKTTFIDIASIFQSMMKNLNDFFFFINKICKKESLFANLLDIWIIDPNNKDSSTLNHN